MNTWINTLLRLCLATGCAAVGLATSEAQTFSNGSFELGSTTGGIGSTTATTTATGINGAFSTTSATGWTTTVGGGSQANIYRSNNAASSWVPNAQLGSFCLQLDGSSPNNDQSFLSGARTQISQTFYAKPGTYSFSFYLSGETGSGKNGTVGVLVSLSGVATGALTSQEYTITNGTSADGSWSKVTIPNFTVSSNSTPITLTFADDNNHTGTSGAYTSTLANYTASSNAAIDNVVLSQVPEPSTWVGGLAILGCFGWLVARRRAGRLDWKAEDFTRGPLLDRKAEDFTRGPLPPAS